MVKNPLANAEDAGDMGSIPELGRPPGEENGNPLQYSCLENPMDRGAWQSTVHSIAMRQTQLKQFSIARRNKGKLLAFQSRLFERE